MTRLVVLSFALVFLLYSHSPAQRAAVVKASGASASVAEFRQLPSDIWHSTLRSTDGSTFSLADYEGNTIILNLWATWLGPSRLEIPELVKLQTKFQSQGIRVVGLSTERFEDSDDQVREMMRSYGINYAVGWAPRDFALALMQGRDAIPQTFVIVGDRRILKVFVGFNPSASPAAWEAAIKQALDGTPNPQGAPANPNFTGEWILEAQTDSRGNLVRRDPARTTRLKVVHNEPEISFTFLNWDPAQPGRTATYYTDGRGEKNHATGLTINPPSVPNVVVSSETKWKKTKLVIRGYYRQPLAGRFHEVKREEEWELATDGSLVQRTTLEFEDTPVQIPGRPREPGMVISSRPVKTKSVYKKI